MMFSVIVPTHNRISSLKQTLESLFHQDYDDYEIIVVNDGSTDDTDEYLSRLASQGRISYLPQSNRGPAVARNLGLEHARGGYIAYTDDDCVVPTNWLRRLSETFDRTGADIVGGKVINCVLGNIFSEVSQEISSYWVQFCNREGGGSAVLTSNNIGYRSEAIKKAGGFNERFRYPGFEERALNFRILRSGGTSAYDNDLTVQHFHAMTASNFFRQQFYYGRGAYLYYRVLGKELGSAPSPLPLAAYISLVNQFLRGNILKGLTKTMIFVLAQVIGMLGLVTQTGTASRS